MAQIVLKPDGDNSVAWTRSAGGTNASAVDEGTATHNSDTDYVYFTGNATGQHDFYSLEAVPADFDTANWFRCRAYFRVLNNVDDYVSVAVRVSGIGTSASVASAPTSYTLLEHSSDQANTDDDATWDSHEFNVTGIKVASGMADSGHEVRITAVDVLVDYNTTGPAVTQPYYARTGGVPGMRIGRPGAIFGRTW